MNRNYRRAYWISQWRKIISLAGSRGEGGRSETNDRDQPLGQKEARHESDDRDQTSFESSIDAETSSRWLNLQQPEQPNTPNSMFNAGTEKDASACSVAGDPVYDKTPFAPATGADEEHTQRQINKESSVGETSQGKPVFNA